MKNIGRRKQVLAGNELKTSSDAPVVQVIESGLEISIKSQWEEGCE